MNKEQIIDEAYENYKSTTLESDMKKSAWELTVQSMSGKKFIISQEEFINKCKTDSEFSEKWGLKESVWNNIQTMDGRRANSKI